MPANSVVIATLTFDVELAGAVPVSGSISRKLELNLKASRPCSDVDVNDIFFDGQVATHKVAVSIVVTSPSQPTGTIGLDIASSITIDDPEAGTFAPTTSNTSNVEVNPDGTGRLDVADWGNAAGAIEKGAITWTCRE